MDTSYLTCSIHPAADQAKIPAWAQIAARQGARRVLELLRSPHLPSSIILTLAEHAAAPFGESEDGEGQAAFAAHTQHDISISFPTSLKLKYAQEHRRDEEKMFQVISYCAAHETAVYVLSADNFEADDAVRCMAEYLASVASGFSLAPSSAGGDYYGIVKVLLRCLSTIRRTEGSAALWRGEIRRIIDDLCERVRFDPEPCSISPHGQILRPEDIQRLLDFYEGSGPWPFGPGSSAESPNSGF